MPSEPFCLFPRGHPGDARFSDTAYKTKSHDFTAGWVHPFLCDFLVSSYREYETSGWGHLAVLVSASWDLASASKICA